MSDEILTFKDIQDGILLRGKIDDTVENRSAIKEYINTCYLEIAREEAYEWSGDTLPIMLKGKYTTGTLTATNGSDTVTGSGTTWVENTHRFNKMHISGSNTIFKVLRVASTTSITLDQPWTGTTTAGLGYTLYKDEYGLFPDCQGVRTLRIPGLNRRWQPKPVGIRQLDTFRDRSPFREGNPMVYSIFGKGVYTEKTWATFNLNYDYWEDSLDSEAKNKSLHIWPGIMSADRTALVRYTKAPYKLVNDTDEPWIPREDRIVLVWGVLAERFLVNRDVQIKREWQEQYMNRKKKMASQIEPTDDELVLNVDFSQYRRVTSALIDEDEFTDV